MSRLQEHQKKEVTNNIFLVFVGFIILIIFIFTTGIKLLLNGSVFIANLFAKKENKTTIAKNDDYIAAVDINNIPTATNSATIEVAGSVLNFDTIDFYLNDEKIKSIPVTNQDNFLERIDGLKAGNNELYIIGSNKQTKKQKETPKYQILYQIEKPKLEIKEPTDGATVTNSDLRILGATNKEIFIKINGLPIVVDALGNFQTALKLKEGENRIEISAEDMAGNIEKKVLTVNYRRED